MNKIKQFLIEVMDRNSNTSYCARAIGTVAIAAGLIVFVELF